MNYVKQDITNEPSNSSANCKSCIGDSMHLVMETVPACRPNCRCASIIFTWPWRTSSAAGLHDQAEQIAQQIDRIMREHAPGPPERRDPDARPPREGRPEPGHEIVGQLRGEIEQLRRENEEMRRMMQEIREAQERFMKELRERE